MQASSFQKLTRFSTLVLGLVYASRKQSPSIMWAYPQHIFNGCICFHKSLSVFPYHYLPCVTLFFRINMKGALTGCSWAHPESSGRRLCLGVTVQYCRAAGTYGWYFLRTSNFVWWGTSVSLLDDLLRSALFLRVSSVLPCPLRFVRFHCSTTCPQPGPLRISRTRRRASFSAVVNSASVSALPLPLVKFLVLWTCTQPNKRSVTTESNLLCTALFCVRTR